MSLHGDDLQRGRMLAVIEVTGWAMGSIWKSHQGSVLSMSSL
jgi:hypothetical protein